MGRYSNLSLRTKILKRNDGSTQKINSVPTALYPRVEFHNDDMYFITQEGDRLDNLANQFYGNPQLWWYIARVNHLKTMNVEPGIKIRVPNSIRGGNPI